MEGSQLAATVTAAAQGDKDAWEQLVARFGGLLWAIARSHRLSQADAADVVQSTWLKLLEHLGDLRSPELVDAWTRGWPRPLGASAWPSCAPGTASGGRNWTPTARARAAARLSREAGGAG